MKKGQLLSREMIRLVGTGHNMFKKDESWKKYSDIIDLPHHVSTKHPHMSPEDRAAQFSPFAALTGHEAAIKETARITDEFVEPDADKKQELDEKLQMIRMALADNKTAKVQMIFFKPDGKKSGGSYETITGNIKKIDEYNGLIVFDDKTTVKIEKVIDILEV